VSRAAEFTGPAYEAQRLSQARRRALAPWLLMAPALVIVLIFFGLPTLYMIRMSFNLHFDQRLYVPGFTLEHYGNLFSNPLFTNAIWTTVRLSVMASSCDGDDRLLLCTAGVAQAGALASAVHRPRIVPAAHFRDRHHLRLVDVLPQERLAELCAALGRSRRPTRSA
jgi:ABC-type Fe3+ transport system permease subunit